MKKVIIGIHGLSNKPEKELLRDWWATAMMEGLQKIDSKCTSLPEFEMVYWADVMYNVPLDPTIEDPEDPLFLQGIYAPSPASPEVKDLSLRKKISDFVIKQLKNIFLNDDYSLNYSFITNAIVKRFFQDLDIYYTEVCEIGEQDKCQASELIRERLASTIKKYDGYEIFVIAHSMGSIIAYDVLTHLVPDVQIKMFTTLGSPLGLPIIINKIALESKQRKGDVTIQTPPGVLEWHNFADLEDNIALNYDLVDEFNSNELGVLPSDHIIHNDYEGRGEKNPHKSYGYLRCPEFSEVLDGFVATQPQKFHQKILSQIKDFFAQLTN